MVAGIFRWASLVLAVAGGLCGPLLILSDVLYRPPGERNTIVAIGGFSMWLAWTLHREARRALAKSASRGAQSSRDEAVRDRGGRAGEDSPLDVDHVRGSSPARPEPSAAA